MNIADEVQLRTRLGAELDLLDPGPLPLDAVVRHGRTVMIRRRALAAAAVVLVAAAAVAVPKLVHIASQPASPLRYHVTVNPPGKGASKQLIATGTVDKLRWIATGTVGHGLYNLCWRIPSEHNDSWCDGVSLPAPAPPTAPATLNGSDAGGPVFAILFVRADIRHLLVSLSNGQTVTLRPVRVFGEDRAGIVALSVPSDRSITEIEAYSATGEVGYAIPFTAPGAIHTVRWLTPSEPAAPSPATYTIASGRIRGNTWAERLYVGPWGVCVTNTWGDDKYGVSYDCAPINVGSPGSKLRQVIVQDYSQDHVGFAVIAGPRQLGYLVARTGHGSPLLVKVYRVGAARFAVVVARRSATTRWIAYSAAGQRLGSLSF
ncbi:MAG TPA: hypothetical protein VEV63_08580 [Streptosporangiaceae bacterium]|nr:hypothetical protein [Streptosporangiaceae bacterium]